MSNRRRSPKSVPTADALPIVVEAAGGLVHAPEKETISGAAYDSRETARWARRMISPDAAINRVKPTADARGFDMLSNDGNARGGAHVFKDSIVGGQYRVNSAPVWKVIQRAWAVKEFDEVWAEEFGEFMESTFNLVAESEECWFDAERKKTFTDMVRLAIGGDYWQGEVLGTAEWIREDDRPFNTALQMVSPSRLSNPNFAADTHTLRRGVQKNGWGAPQSYWFQSQLYPGYVGPGAPDAMKWVNVPVRKPWGRLQVIHLIEQDQPDQTRGIADMVSVLKQMKMTRDFNDVTLQNAVVNATYAAFIESELPNEAILAAMGQNPDSKAFMQAYGHFMQASGDFYENAQSVSMDGVKIPQFFPGTKLNMQKLGTPGGVGTDFERSLMRHIAAGLNISVEEFTRDYSQGNYSSITASINRSALGMRSRKRTKADKFANIVYGLWAEEFINNGNAASVMPGNWGKANSGVFYGPQLGSMVREAFIKASWIGAAVGQVDQMKETQAALLRIAGGLSTYEKECARLGDDWREVFAQRQREDAEIKKRKLVFSTDATKTNPQSGQNTMNGAGNGDNGGDNSQ